ncbi:hypothetical protein [Falsiroseomonas sp. E2-1-a20]|uniref:hypothetical protein n=1 Tax=Falsiroseomonas sp. E2-1-a20 TaxID=3239300 RepID=UPI003F2CC527
MTPTDRAVTLAANRGLGWMLDTSQAKKFALAHWLTSGASGGRLFVRVFDGAGNVREDIAGDVLASITTMQWNGPAKGWNASAPMDDANFNRRQTIRVGASVTYAEVAVIGFDGPIDLQSLRLYGLPEAAPAVLNGTPLQTAARFGSGRREFAAEVSWDLPSLAPGATALLDVTVNGARAGDLPTASLVSSTRFIELDAAVWSNNTGCRDGQVLGPPIQGRGAPAKSAFPPPYLPACRGRYAAGPKAAGLVGSRAAQRRRCRSVTSLVYPADHP